MLRQFICGICSLGEVEEFVSEKLAKNLLLEKLLSEDTQVLQVFDGDELIFDARLGPRTREIYINLKSMWCKNMLKSALPEVERVIEIYNEITKCRAQGVVATYSNIMESLYILIHPERNCPALRIVYKYKISEFEALMPFCRITTEKVECENELVARGLKNAIIALKNLCI
ncbi:MAG: hypothetical protein DRO15_03910 [Thermoprotei archaeon]|nr:MAG: hypothetical protein DRO15_03910 [Thermoprotei archaeon]